MKSKKQKALGPDPFISQCVKVGLPTPVPEYRFRPDRRWKVDYYFPSLRLAVEKEGGLWIPGGGGRHNRPKSMIEDVEKYNALAIERIHLLRFIPADFGPRGMAVFGVIKFVASETTKGWSPVKGVVLNMEKKKQ